MRRLAAASRRIGERTRDARAAQQVAGAMNTRRPFTEGPDRIGDGGALPTLSERRDLPTRIRHLLDGLLERTSAYFEDAVRRTLDETERALFKLAERSSGSARQQRCLEGLHEIRNRRADVAPRFVQHAEAQLARLRSEPEHADPTDPPPIAKSPMQLVDADVLEEDLALQQIASKSEIRNSQALYALAYRLGVVGATPAWSNEALPLGPAQIVAALRYATQGLALDTEHRVLVYRQFDRAAMLTLGFFYEGLNAWLMAGRVLPNFRVHQLARRPPGLSGEVPKAAAPASEAAQPATANADSELFGTLRGLLAARRKLDAPAVAPITPPLHASSDDVQSVLGALQHDALARNTSTPYDAEHFRNTLQVKLRRIGPQGRPLHLSDEDSDTVDLIGLLFDYITKNTHGGAKAGALLGRLHVPVLRVALGDKSFFTRRDHPARELLNTIAETSEHWADATQTEPDLIGKMQLAVDHVGTEFSGDLSVFENLMSDLGGHMRLLARRADVAERRHIDAARGRDRLDIARRTAQGAVARVLERTTPEPAVRTLLEQAWCDALALSALREGENGSEFRRRLDVAETLARGVTPAQAHDEQALRSELEAGLGQIGLHGDDVAAVLDGVLPGAEAQAAGDDREQRIHEVLKATTRFGAEAEKTAVAAHVPMPLSPAESTVLAELRKTPFGTWFEFVVNQQGESLRRKLAWFSTVTGRCLFVNQRGARSEDKTLEQLARDMARGQVRIATEEPSSLIDRAWKAIADVLRLPASGAAR
jgi:hypothetical protein